MRPNDPGRQPATRERAARRAPETVPRPLLAGLRNRFASATSKIPSLLRVGTPVEPPSLSRTESVEAAIQAAILYHPDLGDPLRQVAGLSLLERLMRQLSKAKGIAEIVVLKPPEALIPQPSKFVKKPVHYVDIRAAQPREMIEQALPRLGNRFLVVAGNLLVDGRLLAWLPSQDQELLVAARPGEKPELLGILSPAGLAAIANVPVVPITTLPTYWDEMRGDVPIHLLAVVNERDAEDAWEILLDHVQKRNPDLPSLYFDPPFENFILRRVVPTRITPNQVSLLTTLLGFLVAVLFGMGWLRTGVMLGVAVEVLDGVDGKLARIKHMISTVGELEHIGDFIYENSWYWFLGGFLSRHRLGSGWTLAAAMTAADLADNLAYFFFSLKAGRELDMASPFLRRFRLIAGRRNVYTWIFLPFFFLGRPAAAFRLTAAWAVFTAVLHAACAWAKTRRATSPRAEEARAPAGP